MKKFKLLLLPIMILFLTGCTVDYNVIVTSKHQVIEDITISKLIETINEEGYTAQETKQAMDNSYKSYFKKNNFDYKFDITKKALEVNLKRKSNNFNKIRRLTYFQSLFNDADIENKNGIYSFKTNGDYMPEDLFFDSSNISDVEGVTRVNLNVQFHNVVLESNADSYNKETNTYTWILTGDLKEKSIEFKLSNKKRYDIIVKYIWKNYSIRIIIFTVLFLLALIFIIRLLILNHKHSKF